MRPNCCVQHLHRPREKGEAMKNKVRIAAVIVCLLVAVASACGYMLCQEKSQGIEDMGISTGLKNDTLEYDSENDILYVGTHDNVLVAFQGDEEIWRAQASGAFSELYLDAEDGKLYAANEDNHVYIYQTSDGALLQQIDVRRKVTGIDVNADRSLIAVITKTGSNKSNLIVYSMEGEELENKKYTSPLSGVKFHTDGQTLLISTRKGEIQHVTTAGEPLDAYKTNYEVMQFIRSGDTYWAVNKAGQYYQLTADLECLRSGKIDNTVKAEVKSIGVSDGGEYVLVGSKEGYLFVMDSREKQIYMADLEVWLTDFVAVGDRVYIAGYGDFVKAVHADNLAKQDSYQMYAKALQWLLTLSILCFIICLIAAIPSTRRGALKLMKAVWHNKMAYLMLLPTFVLIFGYNYRSVFIALTRAFTNWSKVNNTVAKMDFVGFDNFKSMVTEGYFLIGMKNLVLLLISAILKTITVPLLMAWLVSSLRSGKKKYWFRFLLVLPMVVPGVIGAMIWQRIYDPASGLINNVLGAVGLESLQHVWLGDAKTALWAVIFMGFPFVGAMPFLVYYGGLINIDNGIVEAARIDGASRWDIFWRVQLPIIRPQMSLMVTLTILGTMQDFNGIFILTGGGPGTSTYVPALELYLNAAQFGRYGYASALGIVLLIFTLTVTMLNNWLTKERE